MVRNDPSQGLWPGVGRKVGSRPATLWACCPRRGGEPPPPSRCRSLVLAGSFARGQAVAMAVALAVAVAVAMALAMAVAITVAVAVAVAGMRLASASEHLDAAHHAL